MRWLASQLFLSDAKRAEMLQDRLDAVVPLRRRIEGNDPDLKDLLVGSTDGSRYTDDSYFPPDDDWERDGRSIGNNTHIERVTLGDLETLLSKEKTNPTVVEMFARGLAQNRSIKEMGFRCDLFDGGVFRTLTPMFKANSVVLLNIHCRSNECSHNLTAALKQFSSLRKFTMFAEFEQNNPRVCCDGVLHQLASSHPGLEELSLFDAIRIGVRGCAAIASMLQSPRSKLTTILLRECEVGGEGAGVLGRGLSGASSLKKLEFYDCESIHPSCWRAVESVFSSPVCALASLTLRGGHDELDNGVRFKDEDMVSLTNALSGNKSLVELNLSRHHGVTSAGWEALFSILRDSNMVLEELDIEDTMFGDDTIVNLTDALENNTKLRKLCLGCNRNVTPRGWQSLCSVLGNPISELEELHLQNNTIDDGLMISFARALRGNTKLRELNIEQYNFFARDLPRLSVRAWSVFSEILLNPSSIMETYRSNHTLQKFMYDHRVLPYHLQLCLYMNALGVSAARRNKIASVHFREGFHASPFVNMELPILPHALAWMGKVPLPGHFYRYLRTVPELFERDLSAQESGDLNVVDHKRKRG